MPPSQAGISAVIAAFPSTEAATQTVSNIIGLGLTPAALEFLRRHDWPEVREHCRTLLRESRTRLLDLTGLEPLCSPEPWLAQMATLPLPHCDPLALCRRLREVHRVEVPVFDFAGRPWLRISIQAYNTAADVDALIEGLRAELSL